MKKIARPTKTESKKELKNMTYQEYLQTEHWKKVSAQARERAHYKCQVCGNDQDKLHIHHNCYDHKGYEEYYPEDLVCLCEKCHNKYHSYDKLVEENNELKQIPDQRINYLYGVIDDLKEEIVLTKGLVIDYIQQKVDLLRENRKKDIFLEYLKNIDNNDFNDDKLPF